MGSGTEVRRRSKQVNVRLTPHEFAMLAARAGSAGMTVSELLRSAALRDVRDRAARIARSGVES